MLLVENLKSLVATLKCFKNSLAANFMNVCIKKETPLP